MIRTIIVQKWVDKPTKGCCMYFLAAGVILFLLKFFEIGPVGQWGWADKWYLFAAPFVLAVIWWAWADASGYTKRKAMDKMDQRKADRREKSREALGLGSKRHKP
jgi:small Trp-rich protein